MLDQSILQQVKDIFQQLESVYTFRISYDPEREESAQLIEFLNDLITSSSKLQSEFAEVRPGALEFALLKDGEETGIVFRGIPNGHEFTSLLLAILNADGKGKNLPDEGITRRIRALQGDIRLQTYVSLVCTNCPDVVQTLNIMTLLNPNIRHEMVDGALFQEEVNKLNVQAVPAVFANGKLIHVGRGSLGELLDKLEECYTSSDDGEGCTTKEREFDVLVLGGGPAGASAAIYSARKGLHVGIVAERIGGQVKETVGIENLISVPYTTGSELADNLRTHLTRYPVELFENRRIEEVHLKGSMKQVVVKGNEVFRAPAVIIATGAGHKHLGLLQEKDLVGKGVGYCASCDGMFYRGKTVAVVGGGNSAAADALVLSRIAKKVHLIHRRDSLRATKVYHEPLEKAENVQFHWNSEVAELLHGEKLTGVVLKDVKTGEEKQLELDGLFISIGRDPATKLFQGQLELDRSGYIVADDSTQTSLPGVYAVGDVRTKVVRQVVTAASDGAVAAHYVEEYLKDYGMI